MRGKLLTCLLAMSCLPMLAMGAGKTAATSTSAQANLQANIQARMARPDAMCGRFDQSKQLVGLRRPVVSHGRFCVIAGKGVTWNTLAPFPGTLRITRDEIVQTQGKQIAYRLDSRKEPALRMVNGVLFSLLGGDLAQLDKLFEVSGSLRDGKWQVSLKGRDPALAAVAGAFVLTGDDYVRTIGISEANGDRTDIRFSDITTGGAARGEDDAWSAQ